MFVCSYICMYVCMYVHMYVCKYVCMYVYMYVTYSGDYTMFCISLLLYRNNVEVPLSMVNSHVSKCKI